jgi:hypothetical protein
LTLSLGFNPSYGYASPLKRVKDSPYKRGGTKIYGSAIIRGLYAAEQHIRQGLKTDQF